MLTEQLHLMDYIRERPPVTLSTTDTVADALLVMKSRGIHAVLVCANEQLKGVFTHADYIASMAPDGGPPQFTTLAEVMRANIRCLGPRTSAKQAFRTCVRHSIQHLPVVAMDGRPLGIVTCAELARDIYDDLEEMEEKCRHLKCYINGIGYARSA